MYMPLEAVRALFAQKRMAAPDCRVAFTWLEPQAGIQAFLISKVKPAQGSAQKDANGVD